MNRRELGKMAFGGVMGAAVAGWPELSSAVAPPEASGIHLTLWAPAHPTDDDLLYFKQLGVDCVFPRGTTSEDQTVEGLLALKKRYSDAGIMISDIDNGDMVRDHLVDIVLNRPGRDQAVEIYKSWVRTLGKAGYRQIKSIMYNATETVLSGEAEDRGSQGLDFDLNSSDLTGPWWRTYGKEGSVNSLFYGREYSKDEIWENYTYFIRQVAPVAEEAGVLLPFDCDDPPLPSAFGVPRIFSSFEDCKKAMQIANSPNVGMCFTCGQWLEGGAAMGIDAPGAIQYFGSRKQIFLVYFRNASATLPHFHETYIDEGYYDMEKIMKALVDVKYDGPVTLDHYMPMVGDGDKKRTYDAFGLGYMRALLQCAQRGYHL
jgi:mannonate dehydratase